MSSFYSKTPILVMCGLLSLVLVGVHFDSHQNVRSLVCTSQKPKKIKAAAEVLFIGSSVVGRSIDPSFISDQLGKRLDRPVLVEKLAPVRSYAPRMHALVRDYVSFRGAPEVVIFNLPYSTNGTNVVSDARMLWKIPFTSTEESLLKVGQSIFKTQQQELSLIELAFHRDGASVLRLKMEKLTAKIYGGLRYPILALTNKRPACPDHLMEEHSYILASTNAPLDMQPIPKSKAALKKRNRRYIAEKDRPAADPTIDERRLESDQINEIIELLSSNGSDVYLTTIPRFNEYEIADDLIEKYDAEFEDATYLNLYSELDEQKMELFQQSFNDGVHVDKYGAFILSQHWVDRLEVLSGD